MSQVFKNGARTELDVGIFAATTQFTVIDGTIFPEANASVTGGAINQTSGDWFKLVLQDDDGNFEITYCYGHEDMTHTFTVLRGQEGTIALDFPVGTVVGLRFLSSDLDTIHGTLSLLAETKQEKSVPAAKADALSAERTITLTGAVQANGTWDASGALELVTDNIDVSKANGGTLAVNRGGTGATSHTAGQVLVGNGSSAVTSLAIDTTTGGTGSSTLLITSGAVNAGLALKANLDIDNAFTNETESTSSTTGSMRLAGGLGVKKAIHTGSTLSWLSAGTQVAPMVWLRDMYRQQVEAASGGRQTVLYTAKGQPSVMNIIPAFSLQGINPALGTGVHPAFIVGGVQKSELFIGTHIGSVSENELISRPGVEPAYSRSHDQFVTLARACGAGWHVMTNAEWSAIALWSYKNGTMPNGNTLNGQSIEATYETASRMDLMGPGSAGGNPRTRTGSGPATWRHDHTMQGISDLCGNVWEWTPGVRLVNGEIHVIANNDAALSSTDFSAEASAWKAVDGATGELVEPGHANAVKYATSGTAAYTLVREDWKSFEGMTNPGSTPVSEAALQKLKAFGLFPVASSGLGGDTIGYVLTGERLPIRGGGLSSGVRAGVFMLEFYFQRSLSYTTVGARPAFVL